MGRYKICKYCGGRSYSGDVCTHCADKLKRIRTIKAMLLGCTIEEVKEQEKHRK